MRGEDTVLPNPYGEDSSFGKASESALSRRVNARDTQRIFWTKISTMPTLPKIRVILSLISTIYAIFLFSNIGNFSYDIGILLFLILSIVFFPAMLASNFAHMSARDRLQLKVGGKKSLEAYPGVERILNTLNEKLLRERTRILCSLLAGFSIFAAQKMPVNDPLNPTMLGLTIVLSLIALFNSSKLEQNIPMRAEDFPLLSLHAPTLHQSTLNWVLSDLIVAHLDPESAGLWEDWIAGLTDKVRMNQTSNSAVEHLLRVLHLNHLELLDEDRLMSEAKRVFRVAAIDQLTSDNSKFNIKSLRRLMAHTRAWQPGLFRLIDRLQDSTTRGHYSLTENDWRMDLDLPPRCSQGQGDLFVMIHNHSKSNSMVEVEILSADGKPQKQTLRVKTNFSKRPKGPVILGEEGNDIVNVLGKLIDNCIVLWIGLAWPDNTTGSKPVQVTLRGQLGETLSSIVVTTSLSSGINPESAGERMLDAAVAVRRLAISIAD